VIEIYACTAIFCAASLLVGAAILRLCGAPRPLWLSGAVGLAALVAIAPFVIRLPGRGTTAAIVIAALLVACGWFLWRDRRERDDPAPTADGPSHLLVGTMAALLAVGLASLPFFFQDHTGVLGEGIYINDHAAQLYWADWLQHGFGPEPNGVSFGYPIGPQALTATLATATGADLISAFNGLLLAIPALTALTALAALRRIASELRVIAAALVAVCFLAATFLAQSAFKETAMALFVLAFALTLQGLRPREEADPADDSQLPPIAVVVAGLVLAAGSMLTYSLPGLAWFAIALVLWLGLEALTGRSPVDYRALGTAISRHRVAVALAALVLIAVTAVVIGPAANFIERINDVQASLGRLGSPIFPGEALGIWPEGDFRIVRGEVPGSLIATAAGIGAAAFGAWVLWHRRELALLSMLATGAIVYVGARLFAEIHVEAKALAVVAPLVLLVGLRALLARRENGESDVSAYGRCIAGGVIALAALASTLLALLAAPVGSNDRGEDALQGFAERIDGDTVAFLGVDRFAGYYLRGTLARAPAGYVPEEVEPREEKPWLQGYAVDFDNLDAGKLDQFEWAITTAAAFNSTPPANFERVTEEDGYVLWRRTGETPKGRIVSAEHIPVSEPWTTAFEANGPGGTLDCESTGRQRFLERGGRALVLPLPTIVPPDAWVGAEVRPAAGGQERGFSAQSEVATELPFVRPGQRYELSLQYHSQVPLTLSYDGKVVAELRSSLEGMYFDGAGRGAFWPAGEIVAAADGVLKVIPDAPDGLRDSLGVENRLWLGVLAATPAGEPAEVALAEACGGYVDHFTLDRGRSG
jgi:hypothetical protein